MKGLSVQFQKLIVWLTGYLSIIAFVVAGGYLYQKTEDEEVKSSAKVVLLLTAGFTAIEILLSFLRYCLYIVSAQTGWVNTIGYVVEIIKIIAFVALFIIDIKIGFGGFSKTGFAALPKGGKASAGKGEVTKEEAGKEDATQEDSTKTADEKTE